MRLHRTLWLGVSIVTSICLSGNEPLAAMPLSEYFPGLTYGVVIQGLLVPVALVAGSAPILLDSSGRERLRHDWHLYNTVKIYSLSRGCASPHRFGIACHPGLLCDTAAIGVAKSCLITDHGPVPASSIAALVEGGGRIEDPGTPDEELAWSQDRNTKEIERHAARVRPRHDVLAEVHSMMVIAG